MNVFIDAYVSPFESNISRNKLLSGFLSIFVPSSTSIIRIQSDGDCTSYVDIPVEAMVTTTTSSTPIPPTTTTTTTVYIPPTTTTTTTSEPIIADTIFNIFPAYAEGGGSNPRDQYWSSQIIGEDVPLTVEIQAIETAHTGGLGQIYVSVDPNPDYDSKVWDAIIGSGGTNPYSLSFVGGSYVYFRVIAGSSGGDHTEMTVSIVSTSVGVVGTPFQIFLESTNGSPITTTTTLPLSINDLLVGVANSGTTYGNAITLCGELYDSILVNDLYTQQLYFASTVDVPIVGDILYIDNILSSVFVGGNLWYGLIAPWDIITDNTYNYVVKVSNIGAVVEIHACSGITTTTTSTTSGTTVIDCAGFSIEFVDNQPTSSNTWDLSITLPIAANTNTLFQISWTADRIDVPNVGSFSEFVLVASGNTIGTLSTSNGLVQVVGESWTVTSKSITSIIPNTQFSAPASCAERAMRMCVNDTFYNSIGETIIPYVLTPIVITTPTKAGYNFFFLSIPTDKDFSLIDSFGTNLRSQMSIDVASGVGGLDARVGYFPNYIYKLADVFATAYTTQFTLTLI